MASQLAIYLRNHEAAASAGYDLFRRTMSSHRRKPYATELRELVTEARKDLNTLRELMRSLQVPTDQVLGVTLRLGERAGRLKPNGHLIRRAPLSDLVEIEGLLNAVHAKAAGWEALAAAGISGVDVATLLTRARSQSERLAAIHRSVAAVSLNADW